MRRNYAGFAPFALASSLSGRTIQRVAMLSDRCDSPQHRADVDGAAADAGDQLRSRVRFAGAIELKEEARKLN
jgi:hypothetical protein